MRLAAIIILFWAITGIITSGAANAYFRNEYPSLYAKEGFARTRCGSNFAFGLAGPIGLLVVTFTSGFFYHGLDYSCHALERK